MASYDGGFQNAIASNPFALIVVVLNFLISLFVGGLCVFHTYLSCTNQTTFDNVRGENIGLYGSGMDLIYDLFYLREPTKVKGLDYDETLSSSSSEDEEEDETDDEVDNDQEDWESMNNRMIENMNHVSMNSNDDVNDTIAKANDTEKGQEKEGDENGIVVSEKKQEEKESVASSDGINLEETDGTNKTQ